MTLERVSLADGAWESLCRQWEGECEEFGEEFDEFAPASFPVLDALARGTPFANAGVFAVLENGEYLAACQINATLLPGYTGKVLRVRHIVFSPRYDLSPDLEVEDYAKTLVGVFGGVIVLSYKNMVASHIKFHLRSPAERQFGTLFKEALEGHGAFSEVAMRGAWIYLSKNEH